MTQQAELLNKFEQLLPTLPQKYFGEIIDFLGYLQYKAWQETPPAAKSSDQYVCLTEEETARDVELITQYAEELNREAAEVLLDQDIDL
jgi:hypothetical protein